MKRNQAGGLADLSMNFPKCSLLKEFVIRQDPSPEISAWYQLELGLPSQQRVILTFMVYNASNTAISTHIETHIHGEGDVF